MGTAVAVEALWAGLRDNSGQPLSGGLVYSYDAGTTTPRPLYTAKDEGSQAANPLVLDAYGRAQVWADGNYKLVIKTSAGVTLQTLDNLPFFEDDGQWKVWTPSFAAVSPMTFASVSIQIARYTQVGKSVQFAIAAVGTTGGTASIGPTFTLPVAAMNASYVVSGLVADGGNNLGGFAYPTAGNFGVMVVQRYDGANWALGSGRLFLVSGTYEAA